MTNLYCPHTETCPFYQNLKIYAKKSKSDIIVEERIGEEHFRYNCLALIAIDDAETGIPMNDFLKLRLSDSENKKQRCSHLEILNLANEMKDSLGWLMMQEEIRERK